jgi:transcriptional regulator with XRE-family HTH domain
MYVTKKFVGRRNTTAKKLAERLGLSVRTIRKYTSIDRAEYLATHTLTTVQKPWIDMGISRATWYRRRKTESAVELLAAPPPVEPRASQEPAVPLVEPPSEQQIFMDMACAHQIASGYKPSWCYVIFRHRFGVFPNNIFKKRSPQEPSPEFMQWVKNYQADWRIERRRLELSDAA